MLRKPVQRRAFYAVNCCKRWNSSSSFIRNTFIDYFKKEHDHKLVKSSPVVPLCDPTVPFVNAGMNQFKGVFLGKVAAPCSRAVNSQKCIRVGGKHNDLDVVGTDGTHHTFFEMLGNWSFGDYYKKEACKMAWDLLLGPYRLKPENLVVTYFGGDAVIGLTEDTECRDIWRQIGVSPDRIKPLGAADNFWEMGATGPCGPCTEIHYINPDGSLTEIWNIVFIQCNRLENGKVTSLRTKHVDTGMGLERMSTILQGVPNNYETDLFRPIIAAIHEKSKSVPRYEGKFGDGAVIDTAYRRLADHARMISVCLADGMFPATSLNLKQILRKTFKISHDIFQCHEGMVTHLYGQVSAILSKTYPELANKEKDAKLIIAHEEAAYRKMRVDLAKRWKDLVRSYPEVEEMADVELPGFAAGYKEFKETISNCNSDSVPTDLVFKLYDTHGLQDEVIQRICQLNKLKIDKAGFERLLAQHRDRHKVSFKEQNSTKTLAFDHAIEKLQKLGKRTNDSFKYDYKIHNGVIKFSKIKTKLIALLNNEGEWLDFLDPCESNTYYLITEETNFFCEEGGQVSDSGLIRLDNKVLFKVESAFKIRDFVIHKGVFSLGEDKNYVKINSDVHIEVDSFKRLGAMRNHTGVHLLNAALRLVLGQSVVGQVGSRVTEEGLVLKLSVYGEKISPKVVMDAQDLVRNSIALNVPVQTSVIDSVELGNMGPVVTVPGEVYPEVGLRILTADAGVLLSRELCCGTHVPSTGHIEEFCLTLVKGAGSQTPALHAITGEKARQARELFCRAKKLNQVIELIDPQRLADEASSIRSQLVTICGTGGAPSGEYAECLRLLDTMQKKVRKDEVSLDTVALAEIKEEQAASDKAGRPFLVHFLRCSYLMGLGGIGPKLLPTSKPAMLIGCASGVIHLVCSVPHDMENEFFTAERWLRCVLPVFQAELLPTPVGGSKHVAEMTPTKVSLINCEQQVQDAMRVAIKYASVHTRRQTETRTDAPCTPDISEDDHKDRRSN